MRVVGWGVQGVCKDGWGGGCVKSVQAEYWYGLGRRVTCVVTLGFFNSNTSCNNIPLVTIADGLCTNNYLGNTTGPETSNILTCSLGDGIYTFLHVA